MDDEHVQHLLWAVAYDLSLPQEAIELRLVYVLAAVATVLLANRFILPNTAKEEFLKA